MNVVPGEPSIKICPPEIEWSVSQVGMVPQRDPMRAIGPEIYGDCMEVYLEAQRLFRAQQWTTSDP
jgi:hypothetical protein